VAPKPKRCTVEDGTQILRPLLPGREGVRGNGIRRTRASAVEQYYPGEPGQPFHEVVKQRILPVQIDMAGQAGHVDEVERRFHDRLVGDVCAAESCVPGLGLDHGVDGFGIPPRASAGGSVLGPGDPAVADPAPRSPRAYTRSKYQSAIDA
jgi:hypothetical protein